MGYIYGLWIIMTLILLLTYMSFSYRSDGISQIHYNPIKHMPIKKNKMPTSNYRWLQSYKFTDMPD